MDGSPVLDRDALLALLDRMLRAEARADAPPQAERDDWMFGSIDSTEFTEPDEHGWMAIAPSSLPRMWIPRALCFWRVVVSTGGTITLEQMAHPAHSLARWPAIEQAMRAYLAMSDPDLTLTDSVVESSTLH
ncbi:hypothetical protein [Rhizorhapis sp. SPR117]|uniref:hypothetical protein n=1 Tax=Rhizorhapis sp. SPR117 TaxID=2912611 RepID=UPI001F330E7F|nr:hypothetical protein [Rhizorhapis sp. SPR117]